MNTRKRRIWDSVRGHPVRATLLAAILALAVYVAYLDWYVTKRFDGRRWDLPAQVYAQPLELYASRALTPGQLERELRRLGYREVAQPGEPGTFRRQGNRLDLVTRAFRFWDGRQAPESVRLRFSSGRLSSLTGPAGDLPLVRLDPPLIGSIFPDHGEDRLVVAPEEVPPLLLVALKVVEDRKFDHHHGIDIKAIARALVTNVREGEVIQGGSTLTQQLVKNYFLDARQTLWRKFREAIMAMILEARYEKKDILNAYINEIYLGQDGRRAINGFGLGSQFYFGKPLGELSLEEIALLVAVIRGPSYYDPRRHPERARQRRNLVLGLMAELDVISDDESREAAGRPLGVSERPPQSASYYPAFLELVRRQLAAEYQEEDLTREGLKVFTTLDPLVQSQAERQLAEGLERLQPAGQPGENALEGAIVVMSTQGAEVVAMVGGRRAGYDGFNRALDARRPIGSLVKPAVYLTALETGDYTLASPIDAAEIEVELENGDFWRPANFDDDVYGEVPLIRALAESLNTATVRLGMTIGPERVAETLQRLGRTEPLPAYPSLLLGSVELTPTDVAQLYHSLANGGFRTPLRAVRSVIDAAGEPLQHYPLEIAQAADPVAVYQVNQGLVAVMRHGTGKSARGYLPDQLIVAGKTGTSGEFRDSWFAGFTGAHVGVVWVGKDDNASTGLTGASGALRIWGPLIAELEAGNRAAAFRPVLPPELERVWIEYESGLAANPRCADVVLVPLPPDTRLELKPGCGFDLKQLKEKAQKWLDDVIN